MPLSPVLPRATPLALHLLLLRSQLWAGDRLRVLLRRLVRLMSVSRGAGDEHGTRRDRWSLHERLLLQLRLREV